MLDSFKFSVRSEQREYNIFNDVGFQQVFQYFFKHLQAMQKYFRINFISVTSSTWKIIWNKSFSYLSEKLWKLPHFEGFQPWILQQFYFKNLFQVANSKNVLKVRSQMKLHWNSGESFISDATAECETSTRHFLCLPCWCLFSPSKAINKHKKITTAKKPQ